MRTKNTLRNFSKLELLELLAEQEREIQELKEQLEQKDQIIAQRTLSMLESGNIAQAALALNGVFEAAQKAADLYVQSVKEKADKDLIEEDREQDTPGQSSPMKHGIDVSEEDALEIPGTQAVPNEQEGGL